MAREEEKPVPWTCMYCSDDPIYYVHYILTHGSFESGQKRFTALACSEHLEEVMGYSAQMQGHPAVIVESIKGRDQWKKDTFVQHYGMPVVDFQKLANHTFKPEEMPELVKHWIEKHKPLIDALCAKPNLKHLATKHLAYNPDDFKKQYEGDPWPIKNPGDHDIRFHLHPSTVESVLARLRPKHIIYAIHLPEGVNPSQVEDMSLREGVDEVVQRVMGCKNISLRTKDSVWGVHGKPEDHSCSEVALEEAHPCVLGMCITCGKKPGTERIDNDLPAGVHCDECWETLIESARKQSY